jgi:hypothetical protein
MREQHDWDPSDVKKILGHGIEDYLANLLVDKTVGE